MTRALDSPLGRAEHARDRGRACRGRRGARRRDAAGASAADVVEAYAELPVGRVFYLDSGGDGAAVVFLHARSGNSPLFEQQVEPFTRAGYRFIAFDRVGQGRSTRAAAAPADARPELEQLMDHLSVARAHLVGVAAGGGVALEYVLARPQRVASITVANSIGNVQDPDYLALGRRLAAARVRSAAARASRARPVLSRREPARRATLARVVDAPANSRRRRRPAARPCRSRLPRSASCAYRRCC